MVRPGARRDQGPRLMVHRTGGSRGNAVIDIRIKGFGRFRCSAQTIRACAKLVVAARRVIG